MNCAELETLICDYVDGTLAAAAKADVERHLSGCPACAELVQDSKAAVGFMERAAEVEPPPELITRILFEAPWNKGKTSAVRSRFGGLFHALLQPKFAMGMAMTILSFSMLARFVTPIRQLRPADLEPAKIWATLEDRGYRAWARSVKFYENLKVVYQIQTQVREWQQQQEEEQRLNGDPEEAKPDERKLPVKRPAAPSPAPGTKSR
jgi:hypothetical protein